MSAKIQIKRGLSTKVNNLSLYKGEPVFTTDTGKLYIGDGTKKVLINPIEKPYGLNTTPPICICSGTLIRSVTANTRMGVKNNGAPL